MHFYPFSTSQYGIPLGELDDCREKRNLSKLDVFITSLEAGCYIASDTGTTLLAGFSCTCIMDCDGVSLLLLLSEATLGSWLGVLMISYSISEVNQVFLRSILSGAPICELCCTISVKFGFIVPSLMNGTLESSSSNTTWNWVETRSVAVLELELLIMHKIVSDQYRFLHMSGVPTWIFQLDCLEILHPRNKLEIPMCVFFKRNLCCFPWKLLHGSNPIMIHLNCI